MPATSEAHLIGYLHDAFFVEIAHCRQRDKVLALIAACGLFSLVANERIDLRLVPERVSLSEGCNDLLIATAAAPDGVTLVIMPTQVERETDVAAAAVFVTTLLSPLTVTLCLSLVR